MAGNSLVNYRTLKQKLKISAYGRYLRRLLGDGGMEEKVIFLGKMNAGQMRDRYLKSSLFLCPSALENSPNSLGEAMLLGMPCVCAAVGGIPDIFTEGEDGILYKGFVMPDERGKAGAGTAGEKDELGRIAEALAAAVMQMWEQPEKRRMFCGNAGRHAENTYNREKNYDRLLEVYRDIAGRMPGAERNTGSGEGK